MQEILDKIDITEFISLRKNIHQEPELSFEEHLTIKKIANVLDKYNINYEYLTETGIVAHIQKGNNQKSIALRADIDALPMQEKNKFAHASKHENKMHACGHDGHTAILLYSAIYLKNYLDFNGNIYLIFQPAEEHGAGAKRMIDSGLFEKYNIDCVFAMHNWPGIDEGSFGLKSGAIMASSNEFKIEINGKGGHAAMPHQTNDPIMCSIEIMQALQNILTRNISPLEQVVLSITQMQAGTKATNIIPNNCWFGGTIRTFNLDILDIIEERMHEIVNNIAKSHRCEANFKLIRSYPPTINSHNEYELVKKVLEKNFSAEKVNSNIEPTMGAEDFSFMLQHKKGCYFFIGNGDGTHRSQGHGLGPCQLHNQSYDFNDNLIPIGSKVWIELVKEYLSND